MIDKNMYCTRRMVSSFGETEKDIAVDKIIANLYHFKKFITMQNIYV